MFCLLFNCVNLFSKEVQVMGLSPVPVRDWSGFMFSYICLPGSLSANHPRCFLLFVPSVLVNLFFMLLNF